MELFVSENQLQPELISCKPYSSSYLNHPDGYRTQMRTATSYEFSIYLTSGGTLCLSDGDHEITPGLCRFTAPGEKLCSVLNYRSYTIRFSLAPETDGISPKCRNPFFDTIPHCYETKMQEAYLPLLEKLTALSFRTEVGTALERSQLMLQLLLLIRKDAVSASPADSAVESVRQYLENFPGSEISLDVLGEMTGYHPLYLQRLFKQVTGMSPHSYLTEIRMRKARELLSLTTLSVSAVARQCGYLSVSHFTNTFRKVCGFTPSGFRKHTGILP